MDEKPLTYKLHYERNLPHWHPPGATLFLTFRLAGSLPKSVLNGLRIFAHQQGQEIAEVQDDAERKRRLSEAQRRLFGRWDQALDTTKQGPFWLHNKDVAMLVASAMHVRDGEHLDLLAYCIMGNHVHLVCTPLQDKEGQPLGMSKMLHSLKGYTAQAANKMLHRQGAFWHHESYDHWVRDVDELERIMRYVISNPVKAGLVQRWEDWPWTYARYFR